MTKRRFVERGVDRVHKETCRQCGLRLPFGGALKGPLCMHLCINEHSDHFGHILSEDHPACAEIRYRREIRGHVPISDERPRKSAMEGADS